MAVYRYQLQGKKKKQTLIHSRCLENDKSTMQTAHGTEEWHPKKPKEPGALERPQRGPKRCPMQIVRAPGVLRNPEEGPKRRPKNLKNLRSFASLAYSGVICTWVLLLWHGAAPACSRQAPELFLGAPAPLLLLYVASKLSTPWLFFAPFVISQ